MEIEEREERWRVRSEMGEKRGEIEVERGRVRWETREER